MEARPNLSQSTGLTQLGISVNLANGFLNFERGDKKCTSVRLRGEQKRDNRNREITGENSIICRPTIPFHSYPKLVESVSMLAISAIRLL